MINSKQGILNRKQYGNSNLESSKHLLGFGHLEFEFVSSFGLPAMPVSKSTEMPKGKIVPPTPSRKCQFTCMKAGIRISDFGSVFGDLKTFGRLGNAFLGHKTRIYWQLGRATWQLRPGELDCSIQ